ncbi:MAG: hypothetical protein JOZ55_02520 [Alphaproteobacteria bacterium]|nr:hypothetical protein [Alphaproteobacteria bacterium]
MNPVRAIVPGVASLVILYAPASAQWDTHWNASGPHPDSCVFNGALFYPGDEICVRPGTAQACEPDGTLASPESMTSCKAAEAAAPSVTHTRGRDDAACTFDDQKFSVGAEICTAPSAKQVCGPDGRLGRALPEAACRTAP